MIAARQDRGTLPYLALLVLLLAAYGYFVQPPGANALSRYDLVRALVDDHGVNIDPYHQNTVDKGYVNGHYYSDKAFGLSLLAAPVYAVLHAGDQLGRGGGRDEQETIYVLTLFAVGVPSAALAILVARGAQLLGLPAGGSRVAGLVYGLGTIAFPFATMFFGHQSAGFFAFAGAYLLMRLRTRGEERQGGLARSALAGVLAGFAALVEYPTALVGVILFGYILLAFRNRRHALAFAAGVFPCALALAAYNYLAYGDIASVSYIFVRDARFADAHRGLMGVSWPDPLTLAQLLFAGKGLLVNAPVLALAPFGLWRLWRAKGTRPEALLIVAVVGSFLLYNAGYYLPFGGWTPGPRFLLPALPFLALPLAALDRSPRWRAVFALLAAFSITVMTLATATTPLVSDAKRYPLMDVWMPDLLRGDLVYNLGQWYLGLRAASSLLPLLSVVGLVMVAGRLAGRAHVARRPALGWSTYLSVAFVGGLLLLPLLAPMRAASATTEATFVVPETLPTHPVVHPGDEQEIGVVVRNGAVSAHNVALWLAVYDAGGTIQYEDWCYPLNLEPNESRRFVFRWTLPADEPAGERLVIARVLHWSWSHDLGHTPDAVHFRVLDHGR